MRVHGARDDGEPRAVDDLGAGELIPDSRDPAAGERDVGAGKLPRTDVDETTAENELRHDLRFARDVDHGIARSVRGQRLLAECERRLDVRHRDLDESDEHDVEHTG